MGFGSVSLLMKINFVLIIIAVVIQILGLALPYWLDYDVGDTRFGPRQGNIHVHSGLWQTCFGGNCISINNPSGKRMIYHFLRFPFFTYAAITCTEYPLRILKIEIRAEFTEYDANGRGGASRKRCICVNVKNSCGCLHFLNFIVDTMN